MNAKLVAELDTRRHPVECVSWLDAAEFCAELSLREELEPAYFRGGDTVKSLDGIGYRLPTEAQWEFACRAGTTTMTRCLNSPENPKRLAWFGRNSGNRTHAAGELVPNPFGLFDILGNVAEWCHDATVVAPYEVPTDAKMARIDPVTPWADSNPYRRHRGGDYWQPGVVARSAMRHSAPTGWTNADCGLRVVLPVEAARRLIDAKRAASK